MQTMNFQKKKKIVLKLDKYNIKLERRNKRKTVFARNCVFYIFVK